MHKSIQGCLDIASHELEVIAPASKIPYFPFAIQSGHGAVLTDVDGNTYIDILSSAGSANTGHCHPLVVKAICEQATECINYTAAYTYNNPMVALAEKLIALTPGSFEKKVSFGLTGSDAIDGAIKFARAYTKRPAIISFIGAYHGSTYGSMSLTTVHSSMRKCVGALMSDVHHVHYPNCYRCPWGKEEATCTMACFTEFHDLFDNQIAPTEVAAIVFESIAGDSGLIVPPAKYVHALKALCDQHGILFIADEIQQGFGRTGKWFGVDHFGVEPDLMVLGKSIASGMPLSAIVGRCDVMNSLSSAAHVFTMGGNLVCCRAALATLQVIEQETLLKKSTAHGHYVMKRLLAMKETYPLIGDVRGLGLSIGIELVLDPLTKEKHKKAAAKICYRCWENGILLIFFAESVLRFQPPLIIEHHQLKEALDVLEEAIQAFISGEIPDCVLDVVQGW